MIQYALTSAPAAEPVSVADFRAYARLDDTGDTTDITRMLKDARTLVETHTHRALITQTWTATLDRWPDAVSEEGLAAAFPFTVALVRRPVRLSPPPAAISSVVVDGVTIASGNYRLAGDTLFVKSDVADSDEELGGGIVITFTAGYGADGSAVPAPLLDAIMGLAADHYEHRGDGAEMTLSPIIAARLNPYVVMRELTP